jgi:hypothetical protein
MQLNVRAVVDESAVAFAPCASYGARGEANPALARIAKQSPRRLINTLVSAARLPDIRVGGGTIGFGEADLPWSTDH